MNQKLTTETLPIDHPELELIKLQSCSLVAAFAEHLPLAAKSDLRLKDLRHQPVVALPPHEENLYSCILYRIKYKQF